MRAGSPPRPVPVGRLRGKPGRAARNPDDADPLVAGATVRHRRRPSHRGAPSARRSAVEYPWTRYRRSARLPTGRRSPSRPLRSAVCSCTVWILARPCRQSAVGISGRNCLVGLLGQFTTGLGILRRDNCVRDLAARAMTTGEEGRLLPAGRDFALVASGCGSDLAVRDHAASGRAADFVATWSVQFGRKSPCPCPGCWRMDPQRSRRSLASRTHDRSGTRRTLS